MTKLVVSGSRNGHPEVESTLDLYLQTFGVPELLVLGDARGVDAQACAWAIARQVMSTVIVADWVGLGRSAGHARNARMIAMCRSGDHFVGFPNRNGPSPGTLGCWNLALRAGLRCWIIR